MNHSPLHVEGVRLLRLLSTHADTVMRVYTERTIPDTDLDARTLETLMISARILYRPEPNADLRLVPEIDRMLLMALQDERNRQVDADVAGLLMGIKALAGHYTEAMGHGRFAEAVQCVDDLASGVYEFQYRLRASIDGLWQRINAEFGYVSSLAAKIRENDLAQEQVNQLLERLDMVDFALLASLAGDQKPLRRYLLGVLEAAIAECRERLSSVQRRVNDLMGKFRAIQRQNFLLKGWLTHIDRNSSYVVSDLAGHHPLPALLNVAAPLLEAAAADPLDLTYRSMLLEEAAKLRANDALALPAPPSAPPAPFQMPVAIEVMVVEREAIESSIEAFLIDVIDADGVGRSARDHLSGGPSWDGECWMYLLLLRLDRMRADGADSGAFIVALDAEPDADSPGMRVIRDVHVRLAA